MHCRFYVLHFFGFGLPSYQTTGTPLFAGVRVRMGLHTGIPSRHDNPMTGRIDYSGPVVILTRQVSELAHGGQVLCTRQVVDVVQQQLAVLARGDATADARLGAWHVQTRALGEHVVKGSPDATAIFQLASSDLAARVFPPRRAEQFF